MVWNTREDETALYVGESTHFSKSSRGRKFIVALLTLVLVGIVCAIIVPVTLHATRSNDDSSHMSPSQSSSVTAACAATQYPETCSDTLNNSTHSDAKIFTSTSLTAASDGVEETRLSVKSSETPENAPAVEVCEDALSSASAELEAILEELKTADANALRSSFDDIKTRVTAAMEFHTTCMDALEEVGGPTTTSVQVSTEKTKQLFSIALSFVNAYAAFGNDFLAWAKSSSLDLTQFNLHRRRLLTEESFFNEEDTVEDFPQWLGMDQRRHLLQTKPANGTYNVTVAGNGSGDFKTIMEAVNKAPTKSNTLYVIYIKAGTYNEQVILKNSHTNIMFLGDGATQTILTGRLSVGLTRGMTTYKSATLIVGGKGFLAKGIQVRNTAGPKGRQAVAMRVSADNAAFYQCIFDGYQDTLYVHNFRQFYRDCTVQGTIDFIFGNAAAAFQNCRITAKKSTMEGQTNVYTAQGKTDRGQNTGNSFQSCTFDATSELAKSSKTYKTFLGRPWKEYSTTVLLRSKILAHVDPKGWLPWNASDHGIRTSYFAEFESKGPGALPKSRVPWSKQITTLRDANKYQASTFIQGQTWVPPTKFPYIGAPLK